MKNKKIVIGMFRPLWEDVANVDGFTECSCGHILQTLEALRDHWQLGHFDTPIYEDTINSKNKSYSKNDKKFQQLLKSKDKKTVSEWTDFFHKQNLFWIDYRFFKKKPFAITEKITARQFYDNY
jgi:hypothetical protein